MTSGTSGPLAGQPGQVAARRHARQQALAPRRAQRTVAHHHQPQPARRAGLLLQRLHEGLRPAAVCAFTGCMPADRADQPQAGGPVNGQPAMGVALGRGMEAVAGPRRCRSGSSRMPRHAHLAAAPGTAAGRTDSAIWWLHERAGRCAAAATGGAGWCRRGRRCRGHARRAPGPARRAAQAGTWNSSGSEVAGCARWRGAASRNSRHSAGIELEAWPGGLCSDRQGHVVALDAPAESRVDLGHRHHRMAPALAPASPLIRLTTPFSSPPVSQKRCTTCSTSDRPGVTAGSHRRHRRPSRRPAGGGRRRRPLTSMKAPPLTSLPLQLLDQVQRHRTPVRHRRRWHRHRGRASQGTRRTPYSCIASSMHRPGPSVTNTSTP